MIPSIINVYLPRINVNPLAIELIALNFYRRNLRLLILWFVYQTLSIIFKNNGKRTLHTIVGDKEQKQTTNFQSALNFRMRLRNLLFVGTFHLNRRSILISNAMWQLQYCLLIINVILLCMASPINVPSHMTRTFRTRTMEMNSIITIIMQSNN